MSPAPRVSSTDLVAPFHRSTIPRYRIHQRLRYPPFPARIWRFPPSSLCLRRLGGLLDGIYGLLVRTRWAVALHLAAKPAGFQMPHQYSLHRTRWTPIWEMEYILKARGNRCKTTRKTTSPTAAVSPTRTSPDFVRRQVYSPHLHGRKHSRARFHDTRRRAEMACDLWMGLGAGGGGTRCDRSRGGRHVWRCCGL